MTRSWHIVHTESSLGWGGQEIRILTESIGLLQRGHRVELLCPEEANIFQEATTRGVPVTATPIARKNLTGLLALRARLNALRPDILITHSSTDSWLSALATRWLEPSVPLIRLRHISAPVPVNPANRWLYGSVSRLVITTGEGIRNRLIAVNGIPAHQVRSIPTGIDLTRFTPGERQSARMKLGLPLDRPLIGIIATLRSWKGHHELVEAFARINHPTAHLVLVGDGPQEVALRERIQRLGLPPERIPMVGRQNNIPEWLHALDLFVLPSLANEGVPQALIQAMACGLAIVSTPVGGIPEMITHDVSGLLVAPGDILALGQAMERLLANPTLCQQLGAEARQVALERCSDQIMLDRMEEAIGQVISGR
ncbi:MAG: glycosyltransferase family 4 protein [Magnetococcales bacterium]|nr:glycosyltransferase family 4 protein [Magnetococcales bacterium]